MCVDDDVCTVVQVIAQLSRFFKPDPTQLKRRIEALIEKEYLQRMDGNIFKYLP